MKNIILFCIIICIGMQVSAQDILFIEKVKDYSEKGKWGPNLANFGYTFLSFGTFAGSTIDSIPASPWQSTYFGVGGRYQQKIWSGFDLNYDLGIGFYDFYFKQTATKKFPDNLVYNKESLSLLTLTGGFSGRINIGRHGNKIRKYMDLGATGDLILNETHNIFTKTGKIRTNSSITGITNVNTLNYWGVCRFGIQKTSFYAKYRLNNSLKKSSEFGELPALQVGFEIDFF